MGGRQPPLMTCVRLYGFKRVVGMGLEYIWLYTYPVKSIKDGCLLDGEKSLGASRYTGGI